MLNRAGGTGHAGLLVIDVDGERLCGGTVRVSTLSARFTRIAPHLQVKGRGGERVIQQTLRRVFPTRRSLGCEAGRGFGTSKNYFGVTAALTMKGKTPVFLKSGSKLTLC